MTTKISEFDRRIKIFRFTKVKDEEHNEVGAWEEYYSCYAGLLTSDNGAAVEEGREAYNTGITFKIRYCATASAIVPKTFRILYGGVLYEIESAVDVNGAHEIVKMRGVRKDDN